jgi:hypothetical protein
VDELQVSAGRRLASSPLLLSAEVSSSIVAGTRIERARVSHTPLDG